MRHHLFHRFCRRGARPLGRAGTAAIAALAASAWIVPALAQPAPPPAPGAAPPPAQTQDGGPGPRGPMGGPGMMGHFGGPPGMMGGPGWHHYEGWRHHRGPFAGLFFHREDKQLTTSDVQKIAEAFLLWQGERNWKVTDVREAPNYSVEFSLATQNGGVIARFSMDRKTGRVHRIG